MDSNLKLESCTVCTIAESTNLASVIGAEVDRRGRFLHSVQRDLDGWSVATCSAPHARFTTASVTFVFKAGRQQKVSAWKSVGRCFSPIAEMRRSNISEIIQN